jgi:hypothetical protein
MGDRVMGEAAATKRCEYYSTKLLNNGDDAQLLTIAAAPLLVNRHCTYRPDFFLASISAKSWRPYVMEVTYGTRVVGVLYAKEKLVAGFPTGVIYCDAILGTNLVAEPGHQEEVLGRSVRYLAESRRPFAFRLLLPQAGFEEDSLSSIASSLGMDMALFRACKHSRLELPSSYDLFLNSLGARTRRNFRYYRHRFEAKGGRYVDDVSLQTFCSAAWSLIGKSALGTNKSAIQKITRMLSAVREPLLVGLQSSDGEWLSVAGGWCDCNRATLLFQLNSDEQHRRDSLAQVLRSYLIETLIEKGISEITFWAGTSAPLARYARNIPAVAFYLDSRTVTWRLFRTVVSSIAFLLPRPLNELGAWIAPDGRYRTLESDLTS